MSSVNILCYLMDKKKYKKTEPVQDCIAEAAMPYGDINAMKVQLVNRIMRMKEPKEVLSVLNFVKNQKDDESEFDKEWNRSMSVEEFRALCKNRLKKIYAGSGN